MESLAADFTRTLQHFWQLLLQRSSIDTGANMTEWREATAVVLTTFFERLKEVKVEELEGTLASQSSESTDSGLDMAGPDMRSVPQVTTMSYFSGNIGARTQGN